ncbi:MAG: D-alanyl-D-alanine carboxypeptidase/D-alanyl-D-alanine endopeptidase [Planctomycetota bacterium]
MALATRLFMLSGLLVAFSSAGGAQSSAIERALARQELAGARVAVAVRDLDSGELLFARNVDELLIPASNLKLITTAAALTMLGPEAVFETKFLSTTRPDSSGRLAGDLLVVGGGDPCLRSDLLAPEGVRDPAELLVDLLLSSGVKSLGGRLILDDSFFDQQWVHTDWKPADLDNEFASPVGALSMHGNCLSVAIDGLSARLATPTLGYTLRTELRLADESNAFRVGLLRPEASGSVLVRGEVGRSVGQRELLVPVVQPTEFFGRCLAAALQRREMLPSAGLLNQPGAAREAGQLQLIAALRTPLENALTLANKDSDNSISDHLFKRLGALVVEDGSFAGGARAVATFLDATTGPAAADVVLRDGSGLSNKNRVTARVLVDTLAAMARSPAPVRDRFLRTLPVSGRDGSLRDRLREAPYAGAVRAKTGYISRSSSLSGYAHNPSGRSVAFSILINGYSPQQSNTSMKAIQDDICRALVDWR